MRPGFDPFGWMVWGQQVLHGSLNTSGAPSWKPMTFVFTLPYALFGHTQVWLWSVTSVTGTIAAGVFAARVAYRLTGPVLDSRRFAPFVAGAFAGVAVMGIETWPHLVLIANSDQLVVALLLAAIDAHLSGHRRWAFAALAFASLDRPETWVFLALYGLLLEWADPGARLPVVLVAVLIGAAWFVVPGLTSKSVFSPGDLALNQHTVIHGSKFVGVLRRWRNLYELPMQLAFVAGVAVAIWRRDRQVLGVSLIGAARLRVHDWRVDLPLAKGNGRQNRRLIGVVGQIGGGSAVRACGKPATIPGTQSTLAWAVGLNVGDVSNHIGRAIRKGRPVVAFSPHDHGWHVRVYNQPPAQATRCDRLRADTAQG